MSDNEQYQRTDERPEAPRMLRMPRLFSETSSAGTPAEEPGVGEGRGGAEAWTGAGLLGGARAGRVPVDDDEVDPDIDSAVAANDLIGNEPAADDLDDDRVATSPPAPPRTTWASRQPPRTRQRTRATDAAGRVKLTGSQRVLILDSWLRSRLPASEFAPLVGVTPTTLYGWKKRFQKDGPAGLADKPKGAPRKTRLPEATRRAILLMKHSHPDWGEERIHHELMRSEGYGASPGTVGRILRDAGFVTTQVPTRPHPPRVTRFERARANQLWQTDLFTFTLKREARRVHLVAFLDDHSRFIVGFGLHATASGALVREVFESAIANFGAPTEVLTDNGTQYHTWRGKSGFKKLCDRRGIQQIVASPRRPQTCGKIERFWGSLWRECVEEAVFRGIDDARRRIALYVDHYNFQRPHQGIEGLVPADRFFAAAKDVLETLKARVQANALSLAKNGEPRKPFYLTGRVGDQAISLHAEGERVVLTREDGTREEVDLGAPGLRAEEGERQQLAEALTSCAAPPDHPAEASCEDPAPPGSSPLDDALDALERGLEREPYFGDGLDDDDAADALAIGGAR